MTLKGRKMRLKKGTILAFLHEVELIWFAKHIGFEHILVASFLHEPKIYAELMCPIDEWLTCRQFFDDGYTYRQFFAEEYFSTSVLTRRRFW